MTEENVARWYFGGLAASAATCFTHPLDLVKVHLQTSQTGKMGMSRTFSTIVKNKGVFALYHGVSASILRQLTYSTTRFSIYEIGKQKLGESSFSTKVLLAAGAGACGGWVGTPADMVAVRMQNDIKLPPEKRRNYKHALDGLIKVYREEGFVNLFRGATIATSRAVSITVGQFCFYDLSKATLIETGYFADKFSTHLLSSFIAGICATMLSQPIDVIKTRVMNSKTGEFKNYAHVIKHTSKLGPLAFYKGFVPSFIRPHTMFTFVIYEYLRKHFGYIPK